MSIGLLYLGVYYVSNMVKLFLFDIFKLYDLSKSARVPNGANGADITESHGY